MVVVVGRTDSVWYWVLLIAGQTSSEEHGRLTDPRNPLPANQIIMAWTPGLWKVSAFCLIFIRFIDYSRMGGERVGLCLDRVKSRETWDCARRCCIVGKWIMVALFQKFCAKLKLERAVITPYEFRKDKEKDGNKAHGNGGDDEEWVDNLWIWFRILNFHSHWD